jgi:type II secretory ATPase GspE/PulE/Tfp pilus assembly ATPase PilB-like protein
MPIENEALRYVSEDDARELGVAPFKVVGKNIHVVIHTPNTPGVVRFKEMMEEKSMVSHFYMGSMASLEKVWDRFKEISYATNSRVGGLDLQADVLKDIGNHVHTLQDATQVMNNLLEDNTGQHKISHLLEIMLGAGITLGASDIHIEPQEDTVRLRFRIDGTLLDVLSYDYKVHKLINSRLKLVSGLKLTNESKAQDGRFSIFIDEETEISVRVSTVPGAYGEGFVMRLLNPKSIQVKLEDMGINEDLYKVMMREITKPNGLILLTGPTGSGKTTTLYAFLQKIYSPEIKIITIEDPIEYHLKGITQTQVEHEKGYDFISGLRAALRQDPDVIMVGEIRDDETAKIAVESALTGHLVFSTLHTNNAQGVIPRLADLSVNPKIMVSALTLSIAQRLVRKLCQNCRTENTDISDDDKKLIHDILAQAILEGKNLDKYSVTPDMPITLYSPVGCEKCSFTGYKGRVGIFEAIMTDEKLEEIIPSNPSEREIKKVSEHQGLLDMKEDGIIKVIHGLTSLEEVRSVVDLYED